MSEPGLLVLSRQRHESIFITDPISGTRIEILVVDIRGDKCRLGIRAPIEWPVHRSEVQSRIDEEAAEETRKRLLRREP